MITETAHITIDPAQATAFEEAVYEASSILRAAEGCRSMMIERLLEDPSRYRLRVEWDSADHHKVKFRESEGFRQWRALAGPFFVGTPVVEYTQTIGTFF